MGLNSKIGTLILGLTIALFGCSKKSYGPPENRPPQDNIPQGPVAVTEYDYGTLEPLQTYLDVLHSDKSQAVSAFDLILTKVVNPLIPALLPEGRTIDREFAATPDFLGYVEALHAGFAKLYDLDPKRPELKSALERYEATTLKTCTDGTDDCRNMKVLSRDRGFLFQVVTLNKVLKPGPAKEWTYFTFGLGSGNFPATDSLVTYGLKTADAYLNWLMVSTSTDRAVKTEEFKRIFNQFVIASAESKPAILNYLNQIDIWGDAIEKNDPREVLRDSLGSLLTRNFTYVDKHPTASFQKFIDRNAKVFSAETMEKFASIPRWSRVEHNYGLKEKLASVDPALITILDLAFSKKMATDDVDAIMRIVSPDPFQLLRASEVYLQIRFMTLALQTQEEMAVLIGNPTGYTTLTKFVENLRKVSAQETNWKRFRDENVASVDQLVTSYLPRFLDAKALEDKERIFNRMDQNIKWEVIYPNMLPVTYYIGTSKMKDVVTYLWWTMTIDSDLIYEYLFSGRFETWFNFTNSLTDNKMSAAAALQSFDYAVTTELFNAYNLRASDFLLSAIDHLTAKAVVRVESSNEQIVNNLMTNYDLMDLENWKTRNRFMKISDWCRGKGKGPEEEIDLLNLTEFTHPYLPELLQNTIGTVKTNGSVHWFDFTPVGVELSQTSLSHFSDLIRTEDFRYMDQIYKMVEIYKNYLNQRLAAGPDKEEAILIASELEKMKQVDAAVLRVDSAYRKYFGLVYQAIDRYDDCVDKVFHSAHDREKKILKYEQEYLKLVYRDLQKIVAAPSTIDTVNAKYARVEPLVDNYKLSDRFEIIGGQIVFYYNKTDFVLRLRDYYQKGFATAEGEPLAAIAPQTKVLYKQNPAGDDMARAGGLNYQMFYKNSFFNKLQYRPGMTEDQFLTDAMSAFWIPWEMGEYNFSPMSRITFGNWDEGANSARILPMQTARVKLMATLAKLGPVETYDFEKPGCTYRDAYEKLNESCLKTASLSIDRMFEVQKRVMTYLDIDPEMEAILRRTKAGGIAPHDSLYEIILSKHDERYIGWADPVRLVMSTGALGYQMVFPGRDMQGFLPRNSYLDFAQAYYMSIPASGEPLLRPLDPLKTDLKAIYQSYVDRELRPMLEIDKKIDEMKKTEPYYELRYSMYADRVKLPIVSDYSPEPDDIIRDFNKSTVFYFTMPQVQ